MKVSLTCCARLRRVTESQVMVADNSVGTEESAYLTVRMYAMVMVLIYPVGIPLLYAYLLWCSRDDLIELQRLERVQVCSDPQI
jgi:hypothetical protein